MQVTCIPNVNYFPVYQSKTLIIFLNHYFVMSKLLSAPFISIPFSVITNSQHLVNIIFSFIKVLKNRTGNPITLSVLFAGVARRLGVKLEPVSFEKFSVAVTLFAFLLE